MKKKWLGCGCLVVVILGVLAIGVGVWILKGGRTSNIRGYRTIGDIPTPRGYERVMPDDGGYAAYLRSLPLKGKGAKVQTYQDGVSRLQFLAYSVVDMPVLSNAEQCADACMRLRAEYLYNRGSYRQIRFRDVNGNTMYYGGGGSRKSFERYLRKVYGVASTFSLKHEMASRKLKDMQPGDVFVYAAGDHFSGETMGHAIMVVDVAVNKKGKKAFLIAEGSTPAQNIHILRNFLNPFASPWYYLKEDAGSLWLGPFLFKSNELRHFNKH